MEIFAGLSVLVLVLTAAAIAIKTFTLWLRTRERPELLLSLYLTFATAVGYPLAVAMSQIPADQNWQIHVVADIVMSMGSASLYLFTLHVFRRDAVWAKVFVGFMLCFLAGGVLAYSLEVTSGNPRTPQQIPGFTMIHSIPIAAGYIWTICEAFPYYRMLKKRVGLGLADIAVANRVLLWGLMALSAVIALVASMIELALGYHMTAPVVAFCSLCGLVHAICLFLAFHPPAWYRRWLSQGASAEVA